MDNSSLAQRMKDYESVSKIKLMKRCPVIIRMDGKAFHTFTRGFQKPFDEVLSKSMQETMKYLCENIQGCVFGYTQSDEISLVLIDYKKLNSSAWFDYNGQKICSIAASMTTMAFNKVFKKNVDVLLWEYKNSFVPQCVELQKEIAKYHNTLLKAVEKGAMFDARCFNLSKEEVTNNIYWRQLDATRNSIQMLGQANFSHEELQDKTCNDIQDMLMVKKGINWNNLPTYQKRGSCCIKDPTSSWIIDKEIPIFKNEGRDYIEKLIQFPE